MKTPDKKPIDLGPSSWDRYAARLAEENRRIESEDIATVSWIGFFATLVIAVLGNWLKFW